MKGINAILDYKDPGQDGLSGLDQYFAKDLAAFSLEYFNSDYTAINGATPMATVNTSSHPATNSSELFNGNIRYMQTRLTNPTTLADMPMLNAYKYDQLNRLKESRSYETGLTSNVWNPTTYGNSYYNAFTYDAMGNIENQIRHSRNGTLIDNLTYHYQKSGGKLVRNRLYHLNDAQTNAAAFGDDIDNMLTFRSTLDRLNVNNNYNYDEEGRLVKDSSERINKIVWRVDGKVKEIQRMTGSTKWLKFDYDAMGNRIAKHVYNNTGTTHERSTYYILDAQGNQISTYDHEIVGGSAKFHLKERNIFGSSRIGSKQDSLNILTATLTQNYTQVLGTKYYEFSNHLGNVLTVFSDVKIALDANSNGVVDGFRVPIRNTADYSPFGVQLDGRTITMDSYRYGFQNQEKDDEIKGAGNSVNYKYRMHDPRVGRFLSIDPLSAKYPWNSPYAFSENRVIDGIDLEGKEFYYSASGTLLGKIGNSTEVRVVNADRIKALGGEANYSKAIQNIQNGLNSGYAKSKKHHDYLNSVSRTTGMTNEELNQKATLSTIKKTEAGRVNPELDYNSAHGTGNVFTENSYKDKPEDYASHPGIGTDGYSASGAYQFTEDSYKDNSVTDNFSPENQDQAAVNLMNKSGYVASLSGDIIEFKKAMSVRFESLQFFKDDALKDLFKSKIAKELNGTTKIATPKGTVLERQTSELNKQRSQGTKKSGGKL